MQVRILEAGPFLNLVLMKFPVFTLEFASFLMALTHCKRSININNDVSCITQWTAGNI